MAGLEGGRAALATATGLAAQMIALLTLCAPATTSSRRARSTAAPTRSST